MIYLEKLGQLGRDRVLSKSAWDLFAIMASETAYGDVVPMSLDMAAKELGRSKETARLAMKELVDNGVVQQAKVRSTYRFTDAMQHRAAVDV